MTRDFTLVRYENLLTAFIAGGYSFRTYEESLSETSGKFVILRHDVDKKPENSLKTAEIEKALGIKGSYYFRAVRKEDEIPYLTRIFSLGHEIGYHYEDFSSHDGNFEDAYNSFITNLNFFRQYCNIKTVCMHGDPLSKYDNRILWSLYDYRDLGIEGEPYFDIDVTKVLYLSDTGRRWDSKASIRDKSGLRSSNSCNTDWETWKTEPFARSLIRIRKGEGALNEAYSFRTTTKIIAALDAGVMPDRIMLNIHPQRWWDSYYGWTKEIVMQNIKNIVKRLL